MPREACTTGTTLGAPRRPLATVADAVDALAPYLNELERNAEQRLRRYGGKEVVRAVAGTGPTPTT